MRMAACKLEPRAYNDRAEKLTRDDVFEAVLIWEELVGGYQRVPFEELV